MRSVRFDSTMDIGQITAVSRQHWFYEENTVLSVEQYSTEQGFLSEQSKHGDNTEHSACITSDHLHCRLEIVCDHSAAKRDEQAVSKRLHRHTYYSAWKLIPIYRPTGGRRLSRAQHCRKGAAACAQNCISQWLLQWTPPLAMWLEPGFSHAVPRVPPLGHCNLLGKWCELLSQGVAR